MSELPSDYYGIRGQSLLFRIPDAPAASVTPSLSASTQPTAIRDERQLSRNEESSQSSKNASQARHADRPGVYGIVVEPSRATASSAVLRHKTVHLSYSEEHTTSRSVSSSTVSSARATGSRASPSTNDRPEAQSEVISVRSFSVSSSNYRGGSEETRSQHVASRIRIVPNSTSERPNESQHVSAASVKPTVHIKEEMPADDAPKAGEEQFGTSKRTSVYDRLYSLRKGKRSTPVATDATLSSRGSTRISSTTGRRTSHVDASAATCAADVEIVTSTSTSLKNTHVEGQCRIEPLEATARPSEVMRKPREDSSEEEVTLLENAIDSRLREKMHIISKDVSTDDRSPSSSVLFSTAESVASSSQAAPARPLALTEPIREVEQRWGAGVGVSSARRLSEPFSEASKSTSSSSPSSPSSPCSPNPYSAATRKMTTTDSSIERTEGSAGEISTHRGGSSVREISETRTHSISVMSPSPHGDTTAQGETPCDRASTVPFQSSTPMANSRVLYADTTLHRSKKSDITDSPVPSVDVGNSSDTEGNELRVSTTTETRAARRIFPPPPPSSSPPALGSLYEIPTDAASTTRSVHSIGDVEDVEDIADDMVAEEKNAVNSCHAQWSSRNSRQYAAMIIQSYKSLRYTVRQRLLRRYYDKWFRIFEPETTTTAEVQLRALPRVSSPPPCDRQLLEADDDNDEGDDVMEEADVDATCGLPRYSSMRNGRESESFRDGSSMRMFLTKSTNAALLVSGENQRYRSSEEDSTRENMFDGPTSPFGDEANALGSSARSPYERNSQQRYSHDRGARGDIYARVAAEATRSRTTFESMSSSGFSDGPSVRQTRGSGEIWSNARRLTTEPTPSRSRDSVNQSHNSLHDELRLSSVRGSNLNSALYNARSIGCNAELPEAQRSISPASFARLRGRPARTSPSKLVDHPHPCYPLPRPRYSLIHQMRMEFPSDNL